MSESAPTLTPKYFDASEHLKGKLQDLLDESIESMGWAVVREFGQAGLKSADMYAFEGVIIRAIKRAVELTDNEHLHLTVKASDQATKNMVAAALVGVGAPVELVECLAGPLNVEEEGAQAQ